MAKLVNQNIDITKESIIQDNRVINEAQIVMNSFKWMVFTVN